MTCDHPVRPGEYALCADCAYKLTAEVELSHKNLKVFRDALNNVGKQRDAAKEIAESANLQVSAWRPVIEAAEAMCKKDRWPYLNLGPLAHALDALHNTNDKRNPSHDHSDPSSPCDMLCMEESECICPGDGKIAPFCTVHGLPMSGY